MARCRGQLSRARCRSARTGCVDTASHTAPDTAHRPRHTQAGTNQFKTSNSINISPDLALVVTTPVVTRLSAVTRQPTHLATLVATDQRPGANLAAASVESVPVTVPAGASALVLAVEDGLTLGSADLIL